MSALFSPITLRGLTLRNRIVVSPMCQYSAKNGLPNPWHLIHMATMAMSGAGLFCIEGTAVESEGRITPGDLGLWDDATEAAFRPILATIRQYTHTPIAVQLAHAGRKGSSHVPWHGGAQIPVAEGGWLTEAPSALAHDADEAAPTALDLAGMARIRDAFAAAARRAARLGLDAIEIHGAHGYLLHEFLSPIANQRNDAYGGSLANRMRYPLEVFEAVRAAFPSDRPVGVKLSATDWMEGGWNIAQSVAYARELKQRGADWITASSGGISPLQRITAGPSYQVPFAEAIRRESGSTVMSVGLISEARQAESIIAGGKADLVALARAMLYDPRWPWHAAAELGATADAPPPYWRAPPHGMAGLFGPDAQTGAR
jgi:2,4-dienoyl-CoA reductase-like NADH-dependent reductase (Old Yellow Enzyme family)